MYICARDRVCVNVQRGRRSSVGKTRGHDRYSDTGSKHLGRHEMTQIMEPEMLDACGLALPDELLGYPVRIPRTLAVWMVGEDKRFNLTSSMDGLNQKPLILE